MLVILPFERDFTSARRAGGICGPSAHRNVQPLRLCEAIRSRLGIQIKYLLLRYSPDRAKPEVEKILPTMLKAARLIAEDYPEAHFIISGTPFSGALYENSSARCVFHTLETRAMHDLIVQLILLGNLRHGYVRNSTRHEAILIVYKTSWLTYLLAKRLVTIPYIGLVNIIAAINHTGIPAKGRPSGDDRP